MTASITMPRFDALDKEMLYETIERLLRIETAEECARRVMAALSVTTHIVDRDAAGNLVGHRGQPTCCLSAHIDTHPNGVGYDDRVGIALILHLVQRGSVDLAFVLTVGEETGQTGSLDFEPPPEWDTVKHCVVLDRRGTSDLVWHSHYAKFCTPQHAVGVQGALRQHGLEFDLVKGGISDAIYLRKHWPTVNLSVGFDREHTPEERLLPGIPEKAFAAAYVLAQWSPEEECDGTRPLQATADTGGHSSLHRGDLSAGSAPVAVGGSQP